MSSPTVSSERRATRVELVFRKLYPPQSVTLQPGEIYLLASSERGDLASLVLEKGPDALRHGAGPFSRIVIDSDAKFDDMLAASILQRLLTGQLVPRGLQDFTRYTGLFRDGLRPAKFPLENSLEGVFLAIRCHASKPLTDPDTSACFLADWARLAELIFRSAEHGAEPFSTPLSDLLRDDSVHELRTFNAAGDHHTERQLPGVDYSRERAFLIKDLEVYRQDVAHGEKWAVRLPGKPGVAQGLLLRQPQSVLFKYWTRSQCPPPVGGPFSFVAVTFWHGQWIFSTVPGEKVSLKGLAERLQAAELRKAPQLAADQPWFDGKPTGYQTVAAPRAGTALADDAVVKLVRKWCKARVPGRSAVGPRTVATMVGVCLTVAVLLGLVFRNGADSKAPLKVHDLYVLSVGVSKYEKLGGLPFAAKDAEDLQAAFTRLGGTNLCKVVKGRQFTNEEATRSNILIAGLGSWLLDQPLTRHSLAIITFSGHGLHDKHKNYIFAPHNYNPQDPDMTGIYFTDLQRYLRRLPCPALVIFDTCHSGAAENDVDVAKIVSRTMDEGTGRWAFMVACNLDQKANETRRWKHGAMSLALLECLEGKYLYSNEGLPPTEFPKPDEEGVVYLNAVDKYVNDRVATLCSELSVWDNRQQRTKTFCTPHISLEQIPFSATGGR
jgi:hypothetical protein